MRPPSGQLSYNRPLFSNATLHRGTRAMPLGIRPTVDFVFKLLFGSLENTDLLIHLLNSVLAPKHQIEEVEILNPFNDKEFEDDKLSIVDVKARDSSGMWYVIEVQTSASAMLGNRLVFYTSELYSRQMTEGSSYGDLRPAVSICFLTDSLFRDVSVGHLHFSLHDPEANVSFGDQIQVHLIELPKYDMVEEDLATAGWLERWVYFLVKSADREAADLLRLLPDSPFTKATEILEMIARSPELRLIYDDRAKDAKDRFSEVKDARAEGKAEGERIGETRGKIEQLRMLERFLGESPLSESEISSLSYQSLSDLVKDLERRLGERG